MLKALGAARAMELFKDIEEKKEQVRNPSGYLKTAVAREPTGPPSPMRSQPAALGPEEKIYRRGSWLNAKVFADRPIDDEALEAVKSLGIQRAMELFKDVEEKQEKVANPSGYLKAAVAREGSAPAMSTYPTYRQAPSTEVEEEKIQKRVTWLNSNIFPDRRIDNEAIGAMFGLGIARAFELLKEIEGKSAQLRNPSGYLKKAALQEGLVPPSVAAQAHATAAPNQEDKVWRRASWLNNNVFPDRPIDEEAIAAMSSLNVARAMELFKEVEEKAANLRNPGGYLKVAVSREGTPTTTTTTRMPLQAATLDKLHRRITWLNGNVFTAAPLDQEAREAAASLPLERALEILKDLEGKSTSVSNPSGYVKAAVRREPSGGKRVASMQMGPPSKRQAY